jgi:hypothetical protein
MDQLVQLQAEGVNYAFPARALLDQILDEVGWRLGDRRHAHPSWPPCLDGGWIFAPHRAQVRHERML